MLTMDIIKYDVRGSSAVMPMADIISNLDVDHDSIDNDLKVCLKNNKHFRIIELKKSKSILVDKLYVLESWDGKIDCGGPVKFVKHRDNSVFIRFNRIVPVGNKVMLI